MIGVVVFVLLIVAIAWNEVVKYRRNHSPAGGTGTGPKVKLPAGLGKWIIWVLVMIIILSPFLHYTRSLFWTGFVPRFMQTAMMGRVILPFTLASLMPGQKAEGCLPQGMWKYVGVEASPEFYRFRMTGETGLRIGFWDKGGDGDPAYLPYNQERNRYGSLLVTTDALSEIPTGQEAIVSGTCSPVTVTPNVRNPGGATLPFSQTVRLIFARP